MQRYGSSAQNSSTKFWHPPVLFRLSSLLQSEILRSVDLQRESDGSQNWRIWTPNAVQSGFASSTRGLLCGDYNKFGTAEKHRRETWIHKWSCSESYDCSMSPEGEFKEPSTMAVFDEGRSSRWRRAPHYSTATANGQRSSADPQEGFSVQQSSVSQVGSWVFPSPWKFPC